LVSGSWSAVADRPIVATGPQPAKRSARATLSTRWSASHCRRANRPNPSGPGLATAARPSSAAEGLGRLVCPATRGAASAARASFGRF